MAVNVLPGRRQNDTFKRRYAHSSTAIARRPSHDTFSQREEHFLRRGANFVKIGRGVAEIRPSEVDAFVFDLPCGLRKKKFVFPFWGKHRFVAKYWYFCYNSASLCRICLKFKTIVYSFESNRYHDARNVRL